jgi:hypothetical protein
LAYLDSPEIRPGESTEEFRTRKVEKTASVPNEWICTQKANDFFHWLTADG